MKHPEEDGGKRDVSQAARRRPAVKLTIPPRVRSQGAVKRNIREGGLPYDMISKTAHSKAAPESEEVIFAAHYRGEARCAYIHVPPALASYGPSPTVQRIARKLQSRGDIPSGEIAGIARVRRIES
jgi:hypothetical protein